MVHTHYSLTHSWPYEQLRELHPRHYLLKDTALELFTTLGDAFLLVFSSSEQRDLLFDQLSAQCAGGVAVDLRAQLHTAMQMWRRGSVTNFEYLMILNTLAGRSFNDLMQYPGTSQ